MVIDLSTSSKYGALLLMSSCPCIDYSSHIAKVNDNSLFRLQ
ncbi:hypothetical protein LPE509_01111 [Legionella pneumophila subsp. pneumophila LPE509]|nr:hypothetical protein LPE509_01111 [Legionella pneumophila subsp. pneumophila LPE509]